jgi:competence ComEA-like helix-hairpin-helix protein
MAEGSVNSHIDPNQATVEELQALPGVGPGLAQRIIQGRPYDDLEDMMKVSGIGQGTLDRWRDRLAFAGGLEQEGFNSAKESPVDQAAVAKPQVQVRQPRRGGAGTNSFLWLALAVFLSVFLSVSLTLGILLSINGTLNIGRHEQVRALDAELATAQTDLADLSSQLSGIDQRVRALQGLSGRMGEVEGQVMELEGQMEQALASVESMQTRFESLEQITQSLGTRADRFDRFLDGLQELLTADESAGAVSPQEAPSQ